MSWRPTLSIFALVAALTAAAAAGKAEASPYGMAAKAAGKAKASPYLTATAAAGKAKASPYLTATAAAGKAEASLYRTAAALSVPSPVSVIPRPRTVEARGGVVSFSIR